MSVAEFGDETRRFCTFSNLAIVSCPAILFGHMRGCAMGRTQPTCRPSVALRSASGYRNANFPIACVGMRTHCREEETLKGKCITQFCGERDILCGYRKIIYSRKKERRTGSYQSSLDVILPRKIIFVYTSGKSYFVIMPSIFTEFSWFHANRTFAGECARRGRKLHRPESSAVDCSFSCSFCQICQGSEILQLR